MFRRTIQSYRKLVASIMNILEECAYECQSKCTYIIPEKLLMRATGMHAWSLCNYIVVTTSVVNPPRVPCFSTYITTENNYVTLNLMQY